MKRLKFMLAAATAIGLTTASQATLEYNGSTNFEDGMPSSSYWSFAGAEGDNESELVSLSSDIVATSFPRVWASSSHTNYYKVSTGTEPVLFRPDTSDVSIPEDGLYVDTLVQFTVTPAGEQVTAGSGDKLLIYLKEMTNGVGTVTGTNLVAVAGYYGYENDALAFDPDHEYVLQTSTPVQPGQWYRLTVKALGNVIASEFAEQLTHAAFSIYLDGVDTPLQADVAPIDTENETLIAFFSEGALTDIGDRKLVFSRKENDLTFVGVGFAGEGAVDDIAFTTANPFATAYDFTLTLGAGISGVSFTINGTEQPQLSSYTVYAGDVIEVGQVAYATGYMETYTAAKENLSGDGPYTVGAANCSLTLSAPRAPTVATVSGVTSTFANGVYTFTAPQGCVIGSLLVDGELVSAAAGQTSYGWTAVAGASVVVSAKKALSAPAHAWYEAPAAVVLAENLPGQTGNIVSAFHGQGQDEYLGLTYSTNPLQFDLFEVDGTAALVTNRSIAVGDTGAGFRGVAISKTLGIAMTLRYATSTKLLAYPLNGGDPVEVTIDGTAVAFDAAAFSPDGKYLFSNAVAGESSNSMYVKWAVSNGGATLTKVGSIAASGRGRSLAYGRINGRDLVFGLVDTGKVVVMDMTDDDSTAWTAVDMITDLPAHSYGTLCVSGLDVSGVNPTLTVATSTNNGATKIDVLNVYELTVPSSDAVTASLVKSFDEDALTAAGFGDISDANRYGNTVYVTDDNKTIYFARPDNKLYAGQWAVARTSSAIYETLQAAVDGATAGDTVTVLQDCNITTPLSITKNLTVHTDHTITGSVNYAICIGATVSFEGSGKIQRADGITGSAFCVGANGGARGAVAGGTTGTLNFTGLTVCGGSGGNLIKLEKGTVNMNGGVLKDGLRGIKADADEGENTTSTIVINGGTITNCSACAVMASAESASGTATVTINGGVIAGALDNNEGKSAQKGTHTITIPSDSTALFNDDQSAFCVAGYETTDGDSDGWFTVTAIPSYTITFISGEGSTTNELTVQRGAAVVAPEAAEVSGKTFDSWSPAVVTPAAGDATYTAVYVAAGGSDWVDDSTTVSNQTAAAAYQALADSALAGADAQELTDWAKANSVSLADVAAETTAGTNYEAFLLNCAPTAAAIAEEKEEFVLNITVGADGTITVSLPDGKDYNGKLQMKGSTDLSTWTNVEGASSSYNFYKYELSL